LTTFTWSASGSGDTCEQKSSFALIKGTEYFPNRMWAPMLIKTSVFCDARTDTREEKAKRIEVKNPAATLHSAARGFNLRDGKKAKVLSSGPSIFCQATSAGMKKVRNKEVFLIKNPLLPLILISCMKNDENHNGRALIASALRAGCAQPRL
jgi:hypothetical protein